MDRREKYLEDFHRAIRDGKNENSYKLAWARALVEIACKGPADPGPRTISFEEIAELMIGYYWDHTIYFDLYQGQNPLRQPELVNLSRGAIESFFAATGQRKPVSFVRIKAQLLELPTLKRIAAKILRQDVCHRFLNVGREKLPLYKLDIDAGEIHLAAGALSALRSHRAFLLDSVCLKWAQLCEKWNRSPRIASKVQIVLPGGEPKRGALAKFLAFMLLENEGLKCFYTPRSEWPTPGAACLPSAISSAFRINSVRM